MTYLWAGMILVGIVYGVLTGRMEAVTESVISSSREAVNLCITMAGITAMWTGMMKIAERTGLVGRLSRGMRPVLQFLFPGIGPDSPAGKYISLNFLSNLLGLSWASTASGLSAFKELEKLNDKECENLSPKALRKRGKSIASPAMCTFLIINVSSLQLLPMNMIAYRAQYGSASPAAIVGPAILATGISTLVAVVFCKIMMIKEKKTSS
jgi:spore maturation protein A